VRLTLIAVLAANESKYQAQFMAYAVEGSRPGNTYDKKPVRSSLDANKTYD